MTSLPQTITSRSARADKLVISCLVVFLCLIHLVSLAQASGSASALHLVGDDGRIVLGDGTVSPIAVYKSDATTITIDGTLEVNDVRMQATGSTLSALFTMVNALTARLDTAESTIEQLTLDRDAALQRLDWVEGNVTTRVGSAEASIAQLEVDREVTRTRLNWVDGNITAADTDRAATRTRLNWVDGNITAAVNATDVLRNELVKSELQVETKVIEVGDYGNNITAAYNAVPRTCLADYVVQLPGTMTIDTTLTLRGHPCDRRITILGTTSDDPEQLVNYKITCTASPGCLEFDPRTEHGGYGSIDGLRLRGFRIESTVSRGNNRPDIHVKYEPTSVILHNVRVTRTSSGSGGAALRAIFGARVTGYKFTTGGDGTILSGALAEFGGGTHIGLRECEFDGAAGSGTAMYSFEGGSVTLVDSTINEFDVGIHASIGSYGHGHNVDMTNGGDTAVQASAFSAAVCRSCTASGFTTGEDAQTLSYTAPTPSLGTAAKAQLSCNGPACTASV